MPGRACRAAGGSALVVVLFFVVLLSIVTIAFLSRSLTAIKVSSGSAGETKSRILAASASDIIIGDLKQEIIAGSNPNAGTAAFPVYTPTANATAIPFMNGVPLTVSPATNAIPNMVSRSVSPQNTSAAAPFANYPTAFYSSSLVPPNRAASDPSANNTYALSTVNSSTPSLNNRYVSPSVWNEHYLIPRQSTGTQTDPGPTNAFVPPDWVIVTRSGVNSITWTSPVGIKDPTLTNPNYAVGRYAYAIYNEGGLLDMNAAGYPADPAPTGSATPPFYSGTPNGLTPVQSGQKMGLPLADLTQLVAGSATLTQAQVNNIVGWRNYASASPPAPTGSFGSSTFTPANASNWLTNFVVGNTNGFMQVVPTPAGASATPTDQVFLSRQQLIAVVQSLNINSDFLQYMGTFGRGLEQPSTVPDPKRPKILSNGSLVPTAGGSPNEDTYIGNNDGEGGDTDPTGINPSFLAIRVGTNFTRWNGTLAIAGEPLVKTKFALSWLRMVAYNASNNSLPSGFATTTADPDPIKDRFGLTRGSTSSPWVYNHGQTSIKTLTQVAAANREPDFAELLKAAIIAGSLAKGGPNLNVGNNNYQYTIDTSLDLQVIQIMANLIDQQDTDSYPTVIQINGRTVYGVEDLPYFYRYHLFSVVDSLPTTILSNSTKAVFSDPVGTTTTASISTAIDYSSTSGTPNSASWTFDGGSCPTNAPATVNAAAQGTVSPSQAGEATFLYIPELWNPHDANTLASESASLRPSNFRMYAITDDPLSTAPTGQWDIGAESQISGSGNRAYVPANPTATPPTAAVLGSTTFTTVIPEKGSNDTTPKPNYYHWPISAPQPFVAPIAYNSIGNNIMYFSDGGSTQATMGTLFREPTLLWNTNPAGIGLTTATSPHVTDANTSAVFYGLITGKSPIQMQVNFSSSPANTNIAPSYVFQGNTLNDLEYTPAGTYAQITFFLQYQDPNNASNWITYDVKYPDLHGLTSPNMVVDKTDDYPTSGSNSYQNILQTGQFPAHATSFDPRSARWGIATSSALGHVPTAAYDGQNPPLSTSYLLEPTPNTTYNNATLGLFSVMESNRPRGDKGNEVLYSNPCMTSNPGKNAQMHWFSGSGYSASNGDGTSPLQYNGLFSENNPLITFNSKGTPNTTSQLFTEDADGMVRLAMGAYASTGITDSVTSSLAQTTLDTARIGLPEATAHSISANGSATPTAQSQSRPLILNRPFRSVAEMSYAFRGTPWKNIDFFTPESGDSALLDTFCVNEPPPSAIVTGKVDLNTRQIPVLQAVVAGAYRDEYNNTATPTTYALPPLSSIEAGGVATNLVNITTDTTHAWRGPLRNVSGLVGRYVSSPGSNTNGFTDFYNYSPANPDTTHGQQTSMTYAGLSGALDATVYTNSTNSANVTAPVIQRFREAGIRPLAAAGQVRVWNLLLDIVAQTGHYPKTATGFDQFIVEGQAHIWVHVALDRYTGQVIDKQIEAVTP